MGSKRFKMAAFSLGLTIATTSLAVSAEAAVMLATYHGYVTNGLDGAGVFSSANTDLTGQTFTAGFRYDTSLGFTNIYGANHELIGGSAYGYATPILSAWIILNGQTYKFASDTSAIVSLYDGQSVSHLAFSDNGNGGDLLSLIILPITAPTDFTAPFSGSLPGGFSGGVAQITPSSQPGTPNTVLGLNVADVTVSEAATAYAVPEPATWTLLISGFGAIGWALRIRRRSPRSREAVA